MSRTKPQNCNMLSLNLGSQPENDGQVSSPSEDLKSGTETFYVSNLWSRMRFEKKGPDYDIIHNGSWMALCDKESLLKVFDRLRKDVKRSLRHYWQRTKDFYMKANDREAG